MRGAMEHFRGVTLLIILILTLVILGCAKQHIMIDRAIVLNATTKTITDVKVLHEPTNRSGQINMILPQTTLELGFSGKPMLARQAIVSWRDGAGVRREVALALPHDPAAVQEGRLMNLIYVIHSSGTATVRLD
jgi:hypothetical protein